MTKIDQARSYSKQQKNLMPEEIDWFELGVPGLLKFQASLECPICKEPLKNSPKITDCGHTFCGECITRHLASDNKCPSCRKTTFSGNLRANTTIENLVDCWMLRAAPEIQKFITDVRNKDTTTNYRTESFSTQSDLNTQTRKNIEVISNSSSDESLETFSPKANMSINETIKKDTTESGNFDLVPCPICEKPFTVLQLETIHIDNCCGVSTPPRKKFRFGAETGPHNSELKFPTEKMAIPNIDMMPEQKLRSKLKENGLNTKGPKSLLKRRFQEWITIWNAARDGKTRSTVGELRKRMTKWDKAQEYIAPDLKKMDGKKWANTNKDDFEILVAKARTGRI